MRDNCLIGMKSQNKEDSMRRLGTAIALALALSLLAGCGGLIYTGVKTPMTQISTPLSDTPGNKVGKSSCKSYVWVVTLGDCSIQTAMKDGGISKVHHVDTEITSVLAGIYGNLTIVVYGD